MAQNLHRQPLVRQSHRQKLHRFLILIQSLLLQRHRSSLSELEALQTMLETLPAVLVFFNLALPQ